jgi:DNA-binding transcriptional LysR family regulator
LRLCTRLPDSFVIGDVMTVHQLKIFDAVARHRNISKASKELYMSQPAISHQLKNLEGECKKTFLYRVGHGVELTRDGRTFLERIKWVLTQFESIEQIYNVRGSLKGDAILRIGGSHSVSAAILPDSIAKFKKRHSGVRIVVETANSRILEQRILDAELEIAVISNPSHKSLITYEDYQDLKVMAFVDRKSPLAGKNMTLKQLSETPLVLRTGSIIFDEFVRHGYRPNLVTECELSQAVVGAVQRRMGVGILHSDSVEQDVAAGTLKRINVSELDKLLVRSFIIYAAGKTLGPIAQDFAQVLRHRKW